MTKGEVSKMVAGRALISRTVWGSVKVHGPQIAQQLSTLLFPDGEPANLTVSMLLHYGAA